MSRALFGLDGSIALVTGAAHGLGATMAAGLAAAGAAVALADIDLQGAEARAQALRQHGYRAVAVEMDVRRPDAIASGVAAVEQHLGPIDVLVNNAGLKTSGLLGGRAAAELAIADWQRTVDINLTGLFQCCQAVFPSMRELQRGSIINLASIYGLVASRIGPAPAYSATKAGVIGLTRALAVEWAPFGIRVNALAPTHMAMRTDDAVATTHGGEQEEQIRWRTPLGRRGQQAEIVGPVVFLASDASALVTGHTLAVDGGWLAW